MLSNVHPKQFSLERDFCFVHVLQLDELSSAEQPNLLGLQELDSTQAQRVKELLQMLGYSCPNEEGSLKKDITTPEILTAAFYLVSALAGKRI